MLTHIYLEDSSYCINLTSPFVIQGLAGVFFHIYFTLNRNSCKPGMDLNRGPVARGP